MQAIFNASTERGRQCNYSPTTSEALTAGQIKLLGPNLLSIVMERAKGATLRAAEIAAGNIPSPSLAACLFEMEDVTMPKLAGVDAIAVGTKVWYDVDDDALVSALTQVDASGACYACGETIELSNDVADTVRITFDGRRTVSEAGTG